MLTREDLRPYQRRIVEHIKEHPNCALWVDMGLGKTVSSLTALKDLIESFDVHRILIIAPLRVARKTWDDEIEEWAHLEGLSTAHIIGTESQRLAGIDAALDADITMINREQVDWLFHQFVEGTGKKQRLKRTWLWDTVVIDEAQSFKSQSSQRWKSLRKMRKFYDRCIELTGTPAPNGYLDVWAQMALLDRGERLGWNEKAYKTRWFDSPSRWDPSRKVTLKKGAEKQIHDAIKDVTLSMRAEDYLDLPPVMVNSVNVTLSRGEMETYKEMERDFIIQMGDEDIMAVNAGVLSGKLQQLANGAIYYDDKQNFKVLHDHKIDATVELLDSINSPVMLGYNFKSDLARLMDVLGPWAKKNKKVVRTLTSKEVEDAWNRGEIDVLLLHPASGGHGLNLHKCNCETIILFGLNWSLELYQQLNARIAGGHRRIGKNIIIHHIIAEDTVDEVVMSRLEIKDINQQGLMEAVKAYIEEIANV